MEQSWGTRDGRQGKISMSNYDGQSSYDEQNIQGKTLIWEIPL